MTYQFVGIPPTLSNIKEVKGMELMFVVTSLAAAGIGITIWQAVEVWNRLRGSGKWETGREAMNDQEFWYEFTKENESQR